MKKILKIDDKLEYEFDDEAEYKGFTFISFKKVTTFKDKKDYQNLTIKKEHWGAVVTWLSEIIKEKADKDGSAAPF